MSKKVYTIEVSALISHYAAAAFEIEAPDLSTAKEEAITQFRKMLDGKFVWYKIEELKTDCIKEKEYER